LILPRSRDELVNVIDLDKALTFFTDISEEVRLEAIYLFRKLTSFSVAKDIMLQDRYTHNALLLVAYSTTI
jgi:hypothetical protein